MLCINASNIPERVQALDSEQLGIHLSDTCAVIVVHDVSGR